MTGWGLAVTYISRVNRRRIGSWAGLAAIAAPFAVSAVAYAFLGVAEEQEFYAEGGPLELSTALLLIAAAALCVVWRGNQLNIRSPVPPFIALLMAAREFDADKWFSEKSVLSVPYYFDNPGTSVIERVIAGAVVLSVAATIFYFFWRARFSILKALREFQPYTLSTILGFAMLGVSICLDGIGRKVHDLTGVQLSSQVNDLAHLAEETAEISMALAFLVALLQLRYEPDRNVLPDAR